MKVFHCDHCGHLLFFENTQCVRCGQLVAYLPDLAIVGSLDPNNDQTDDQAGTWRSPLEAAAGRSYRLCRNYALEQVCNWAIPDEDPNPLCVSCRLTRVIPDLATGDYARPGTASRSRSAAWSSRSFGWVFPSSAATTTPSGGSRSNSRRTARTARPS